MTRVLLVDDHQIIIDGLKGLMEPESNVQIKKEATTGKEALEMIREGEIDLILLDISLPDKSGFELCAQIKADHASIKIIALTMYGEPGYINKMIKAGVDGYILKNAGKEEILRAIETVMQGGRYFSEEVTQSILSAPGTTPTKPGHLIQKLTRREKEILRLIVEEHTTDEIAQQLFISSSTVISHRKSLLRKLNAKNTAGLVKAAYEFQLLDN